MVDLELLISASSGNATTAGEGYIPRSTARQVLVVTRLETDGHELEMVINRYSLWSFSFTSES